MTNPKPIAVRHLEARGRRIAVHFFRNAGGSVCGHLHLGAGDVPILDGESPDAILSLVEEMLDTVLLVRGVLPGPALL